MRLLSLLAIAVLGTGLVACGGDDGDGAANDEDPQEVLEQTFNNPKTITSGVVDISIDGSAEGDEGGELAASLSGPFQGDPDDASALPELDLTLDASGEGGGQSFDFSGGLIFTDENAFISYQDTAYEIPKQIFNELKGELEKQSRSQKGGDVGAFFSRFDIDPSKWLTNLTNEGTEDVEGTEAIRIHGDADIGQLLGDLLKIADEAPGAASQGIDPEELRSQIGQIESLVGDASVDVYSGLDDKLLRKLEVDLTLEPPQNEAGIDSADLTFAITLGSVNDDQTIEAPSDAKQLTDLFAELGLPGIDIDSLKDLAPGAGAGSGGGIFDVPGSGGGGAGGGGAGGGGTAEQQELLECLTEAETPEEIQACGEQ